MGGSDFALVLEAITQLDRDLSSLRTHADELGAGTPPASLPSLASLRAVLGRAIVTMRDLRTEVVEVAIAARAIERRESALHARSVVIVLQLAELKQAEHELPIDFWRAGRAYSSLADVSRFLCDEIGRVNAAYLAERRRAHPDDRDALAVAVANAENALDAIGRDPNFACFIAAGASLKSERFRIGCRMMSSLLGIALAPEGNPWRSSSKKPGWS